MKQQDIYPPNTTRQDCHRVMKIMDGLETRLLDVVADEEGDPDFIRLARGVGALAQLQGIFGRRDDQNATVDVRKRDAESGETGLRAVRLTEADRRRMDEDAAKLARRERAANDNAPAAGSAMVEADARDRATPDDDMTDNNRADDTRADVGTPRAEGLRVTREDAATTSRGPQGVQARRNPKTHAPVTTKDGFEPESDGCDEQTESGNEQHPAGREPDTPPRRL